MQGRDEQRYGYSGKKKERKEIKTIHLLSSLAILQSSLSPSSLFADPFIHLVSFPPARLNNILITPRMSIASFSSHFPFFFSPFFFAFCLSQQHVCCQLPLCRLPLLRSAAIPSRNKNRFPRLFFRSRLFNQEKRVESDLPTLSSTAKKMSDP